MDPTAIARKRQRAASQRAFQIVELARRLDVTAEVAEGVYERSGGDLVLAVALARADGLVPASVEVPPISAVGRSGKDD